MMTAEFSAAIPLFFSVTWAFRNPSNTLIYSSRNISYYYQCGIFSTLIIFLYKPWYMFFQDSLVKKSSKEQHFLFSFFICNMNYFKNTTVFTVTFDQFNAYLLNKIKSFFAGECFDGSSGGTGRKDKGPRPVPWWTPWETKCHWRNVTTGGFKDCPCLLETWSGGWVHFAH